MSIPPEIWSVIGVVISAFVGFGAAKLNSRAQTRAADAQKEIGAGELALAMAREAKTDSASAKVEATSAKSEAVAAHEAAGRAQRALHQTRVWYLTDHLPWDQAVMAVIERLDPEAAAKLPPRKEPPLWPRSDLPF